MRMRHLVAEGRPPYLEKLMLRIHLKFSYIMKKTFLWTHTYTGIPRLSVEMILVSQTEVRSLRRRPNLVQHVSLKIKLMK